MIFEGLTKAQIAFLKHIFSQIQYCEKDIPLDCWCNSCRSKLRRIQELAERFHHIRTVKSYSAYKYRYSETPAPRYDYYL